MASIWPFRNVGFKVVSVVLAVLIWMLVSGEQTVERGLRIPLELQQFPAGLELVDDAPTQVDIRVRGASATVARMSPGDAVAVLDLRAATPGRRLFQLTNEQVRVPFGVEVVQVVPATVAMMFERSASSVVPIVPVVDGEPAAGFVRGEVKSSPATVEIVGPASAVAEAAEALTETVSVDGARAPVTQDVTVGLLDPALRLRTPRRASVTVEILPGMERAFERRPVHLRNLYDSLNAVANPVVVRVVLRGRRDALTAALPDQVNAFVDLNGLGAGEYSLTVYADAPNGSAVDRIDPPTVKVTIARAR
jgi:YbbR domain-containing protein